MNSKPRYSIKKITFAILWLVVGVSTAVLLAAAIRKKDTAHCKKIDVKITGIENSLFGDEKFVDEKDILNTIKKVCNTNPIGKSIGSFDLKKIEIELEKSKWVKNAELFFDNNDILKVKVQEREPVARVFTTGGTSFYIDSAINVLPLSDKFSARLPVFTGFPSDKVILSPADSNLLREVKIISGAIQKDSFLMAMIEQVDITAQYNFEMIPKIGNQVIVFGNATDAEEKFSKLQLFYKQVMVKAGWGRYSEINVQFKNQLLAKRRGAEDKTADSVRTLQLMQLIAVNAAKQAEDSVQTILQDNTNNTADGSMIQQSVERDDNSFETSNTAIDKPQPAVTTPTVIAPVNTAPVIVTKPAVVKPAIPSPTPKPKPVVAKPAAVKPKPVIKNTNAVPPKKPSTNPIPKPKPNVVKPVPAKPKVVMPNKNDYTPFP
jgi:cell division protein FtsQ